MATDVPVYKAKSKEDFVDYRPISILSSNMYIAIVTKSIRKNNL